MAVVLYQWFVLAFSLLPFLGKNAANTADLHPFYVSVTEINHNATDKTLEISCKIFTEDLETVLNKNYKTKVDLSNPKNKEELNKLIGDYINHHLQIRLNGGAPVKLDILGFEHENEAVWSYLQVNNVSAPKKVEISNSLLYDSYPDQINLMHVTVGGNRKSTKVTYPETGAKFDF